MYASNNLPEWGANDEFGRGLLQFVDRVNRNEEPIRPKVDLQAVWQDFESNGRTVDMEPEIEPRAKWDRSEAFTSSYSASLVPNEHSIQDQIHQLYVQSEIDMEPESVPRFNWDTAGAFAASQSASPLADQLSIQDQINQLYVQSRINVEPQSVPRVNCWDTAEAFAASQTASPYAGKLSIQDQINQLYVQNEVDRILTQQLVAESQLQRKAIQIEIDEFIARNNLSKPIAPDQCQQQSPPLSERNNIQEFTVENQIEQLSLRCSSLSIDPKKLQYLLPQAVLPKQIRHRKRSPDGNNGKRPECVFCKNNNESITLIRSHAVRNSRGKVTCPILRTFKCPICGETGDNAHTMKYCPMKPVITMEDTEMAERAKIITEGILARINAC